MSDTIDEGIECDGVGSETQEKVESNSQHDNESQITNGIDASVGNIKDDTDTYEDENFNGKLNSIPVSDKVKLKSGDSGIEVNRIHEFEDNKISHNMKTRSSEDLNLETRLIEIDPSKIQSQSAEDLNMSNDTEHNENKTYDIEQNGTKVQEVDENSESCDIEQNETKGQEIEPNWENREIEQTGITDRENNVEVEQNNPKVDEIDTKIQSSGDIRNDNDNRCEDTSNGDITDTVLITDPDTMCSDATVIKDNLTVGTTVSGASDDESSKSSAILEVGLADDRPVNVSLEHTETNDGDIDNVKCGDNMSGERRDIVVKESDMVTKDDKLDMSVATSNVEVDITQKVDTSMVDTDSTDKSGLENTDMCNTVDKNISDVNPKDTVIKNTKGKAETKVNTRSGTKIYEIDESDSKMDNNTKDKSTIAIFKKANKRLSTHHEDEEFILNKLENLASTLKSEEEQLQSGLDSSFEQSGDYFATSYEENNKWTSQCFYSLDFTQTNHDSDSEHTGSVSSLPVVGVEPSTPGDNSANLTDAFSGEEESEYTAENSGEKVNNPDKPVDDADKDIDETITRSSTTESIDTIIENKNPRALNRQLCRTQSLSDSKRNLFVQETDESLTALDLQTLSFEARARARSRSPNGNRSRSPSPEALAQIKEFLETALIESSQELKAFSMSSESYLSEAREHFAKTPHFAFLGTQQSIDLDTLYDHDQGYGSSRKKEKDNREAVNQATWKQQQSRSGDEPQTPSDISLLARLQNKVKDLEREKAQLKKDLDRKHGRDGYDTSVAGDDAEREIYDTIKLQELEIENSKLQAELKKLRKLVSDSNDFEGTGIKGGSPGKEVMTQFEVMTEELNRRREECIQLRTLLASRSRAGGTSKVAEDIYGGDKSLVNEDGELEMAYKTQKDLNKLLENELQRSQKSSQTLEKELRQQIDELKQDNDRQQKLIGQLKGKKSIWNLTMTPEAKIEATMQHEITRLTSENLDLREQMDRKDEQIKKLKKALKIYAKRLKSTEASDVAAELEREMAVDDNMPAVKAQHTKREYVGMLEYKKEEEGLLIRNMIIDLRPRMAAQQIPGLPAYLLFMSIRHTDYMNDDDKVRSLLTNTINGIKKVVKKRQDDVETITLWLSNTCRLLHNLKQYSGEKTFQNENTNKQNEHCLRNFDLSEYRQILSDLAVWIYQGLIKLMESQIHPMIVGAILENEAIAGLSAGKPTGLRGRVLSQSSRDKNKDFSLDSLMKALNNFVRVLNVHAVDPELGKQVFRQLFYFICANALNNLLLRKDMCHWSKGMQMRYNLSHLEQWMRDQKLQDSGCQIALDPIIQASQLLQARKTETDVDSICEMCSQLTTSQIIKILNLYTPVNEFEERVPISFIRKIQTKLQSRQDQSHHLLMDTKFFYAVTFPFNPSSLSLDTVVPPPEWGLGFLKRL